MGIGRLLLGFLAVRSRTLAAAFLGVLAFPGLPFFFPALPLGTADKTLWRGVIHADGFAQIPFRAFGDPLILLLRQPVEDFDFPLNEFGWVLPRQVGGGGPGHA